MNTLLWSPDMMGAVSIDSSPAITKSEECTPQEWMLRLVRGDRSALTPLLEVLWPRVHAVALRLVRNPADADDITQEALLKLVAQIDQFDPSREVVGWAITIAVYESKTVRKRSLRRREAALEGTEERVVSGDDPEHSVLSQELERTLADVLQAMSPADAEVLRAVLREERFIEGINGATFRKRLQRAAERLRAAWRAAYGDE